jgi:hypothetical protein
MRVSLDHCSPVSWAAEKAYKFIVNFLLLQQEYFFNFLHLGINLVVVLTVTLFEKMPLFL